jgi:hypothetical protein
LPPGAAMDAGCWVRSGRGAGRGAGARRGGALSVLAG